MVNRTRVGSGAFRGAQFLIVTAALMAVGWFAPPALCVGDPVLDWNEIALNATVTAGQGPLPQSRSMTLAQVAVHDAVNGITSRHETPGSSGLNVARSTSLGAYGLT